jgi:hypothetical protein
MPDAETAMVNGSRPECSKSERACEGGLKGLCHKFAAGQQGAHDVIADLRKRAIPITLAISFFLIGFFITADLLSLSLREIIIGMVAGMVGGITTLAVVLHEAHSARARSANNAPVGA